jgi:UDP-N-acetylglucosamine acyltransferase
MKKSAKTSDAVHPTAIVHPNAVLGENATIGPYCTVGEHVRIGRGVRLMSHVAVEGWTEIGEGCQFFPFSSVGTIPQDLKFQGEKSQLIIGKKNVFREFITLNRGTTEGGGVTRIGDNNFFMAYVHVAHDCQIGSHVVMANAATLAGHITIQDYSVVGGLVGVHQHVRIGRYAMVGGCSAVGMDVPPFTTAAGYRAKLYGLNLIGLRRHGFSHDRIAKLKKAYQILFQEKLPLKEAVKKVRGEVERSEDIDLLLTFIESSERGVYRKHGEDRADRG